MADKNKNSAPYVEILEQPASKALRFRYECEGRSAGCIPGENSTTERKTYPSIKIVGYTGRVVVVISCVTGDKPHMPHPHSIIGKDSGGRGIFTTQLDTDEKPILFQNLGIQCVKRKDIKDSLKKRAEIRVDPFKTGFNYKSTYTVDLSVVRLCFQVFLEGQNGKFNIPLKPVVSNPIYDKKAISDLQINRISHFSASMSGEEEVILLCEKVMRDNVQIVFYEKRGGKTVWRDYARFTPHDVHKQTAIVFKVPKYPRTRPTPVQVHLQLCKPSDGSVSEPVPFTFLPYGSEDDSANELKRKRQKFNTSETIESPITHRADCNCNCQDRANTIPASATNINNNNVAKERHRLQLLKQLEKADDLMEYNTFSNSIDMEDANKENNIPTKRTNVVKEVDALPTLKKVVPSIFTSRFIQNSNGRWTQNTNANNSSNNTNTNTNAYNSNKMEAQSRNQPNAQCHSAMPQAAINNNQNKITSQAMVQQNVQCNRVAQGSANYQNKLIPQSMVQSNIQSNRLPQAASGYFSNKLPMQPTTPASAYNRILQAACNYVKAAPQPMIQSNAQYMPSTSYREPPAVYVPPTTNEVTIPLHNDNSNQGPILYKINKKPIPKDSSAGIDANVELNSDQFSLDCNPLELLNQLNSADLAALSETFSTTFSICDPLEFDPLKHD